MVTMQQVADAANVSRATVSRVLSNHPSIKPETRSEVMYWVKKLGYEPNMVAQSLAGNRTNLIGVVFPDVSNPLYSDLLEAIEEEAFYHGYSIIIGNSGRNKAKEVNIINSFKSRKVDGIILRPIGDEQDKIYRTLQIPVISIFKKFASGNSIMVDSAEGSRMIAEHFLELGHRMIGYLGPLRGSVGNDKLEGFRRTLKEYGVELHTVLECSQQETAENQKAWQIMRDYLGRGDSPVTAWYGHNDIAACDMIRALKESGRRVPEEVIVAGYNDTILAKKMFPAITTIAHPVRELAVNAVAAVLQQIQNPAAEPVSVELFPRLAVRESTMPGTLLNQ